MLVRNIAARRRRGGEGESWTFGMMNAPVRGARFNHNFPVLLRVLSLSLSLSSSDTRRGGESVTVQVIVTMQV